jgi:hypothetical protein
MISFIASAWSFAHGPGHGRIDHARAHGIDPNAARRTIHRGAFGQADHSVVRGAIRGPTCLPEGRQAANS